MHTVSIFSYQIIGKEIRAALGRLQDVKFQKRRSNSWCTTKIRYNYTEVVDLVRDHKQWDARYTVSSLLCTAICTRKHAD